MLRYDAESQRNRNVIGRRIAEARTQHRLSLTGLAERLTGYGVTVGRTAINKWESGASVPNAYQLLAICRALDIETELPYFMDCEGLESLNAEGQQRLAAYRDDLLASGHYRHIPIPADVRFIEMPVSALAASAGTGSFLDEGSFEMTQVRADEVPEGAQFGVRVSGDSMEPVYHDGQIVWVLPCDSLRPGEVGIFVYDGEGYIKAYGTQVPPEGEREAYTRSDGTLAPQPVLISYNVSYPPKPVSADMGFQIVGKVL